MTLDTRFPPQEHPDDLPAPNCVNPDSGNGPETSTRTASEADICVHPCASSSSEYSTQTTMRCRKTHSPEMPSIPVIPLVPALQSAYEIARSRFQLDVNDLSMLTSFNISQGTHRTLSADPVRLKTLMGHLRWFALSRSRNA